MSCVVVNLPIFFYYLTKVLNTTDRHKTAFQPFIFVVEPFFSSSSSIKGIQKCDIIFSRFLFSDYFNFVNSDQSVAQPPPAGCKVSAASWKPNQWQISDFTEWRLWLERVGVSSWFLEVELLVSVFRKLIRSRALFKTKTKNNFQSQIPPTQCVVPH